MRFTGPTLNVVPTVRTTSASRAAASARSRSPGNSCWPKLTVARFNRPPQSRHCGSSSPARTRSRTSSTGACTPQPRHMERRTVPWTSTIRSGSVPAMRWRPSTFWVTRVCNRPDRSRSTRLSCPTLGRAASQMPLAITCQLARRTSGSARYTCRLEAFSAAGFSVQMPCGPRKSGMPLSVEMPAPVSTATLSAPSRRAAAAATGSGVSGIPGSSRI